MNLNMKASRFKLGVIASSLILAGCDDLAVPITKPRTQIQSEIAVVDTKYGAPYSRIYSYQNYLIATVQNKGIEVIDNSDPYHPEQVMFVNLPGAKDSIIQNGVFVTNQFSDLVFFSIEEQKEISRIENLYDYKDYFELPEDTVWKTVTIAEDEVVVDYKIEERKDGFCIFFCS